MRSRPMADRFWEKVAKSARCWNWTGALNDGDRGYGCFVVSSGVMRGAHRVSWEMAHKKKVPDGKSVLHKCDNKRCVRPSHLFIGTQRDNVQDMIRKGRRVSYDRRGPRNPRAVLEPADVSKSGE